jgi:hypothetical protein
MRRSVSCIFKIDLVVDNYESIYRLVLITHQSRGPVAGAIAGKPRMWYLGSSPALRPIVWFVFLLFFNITVKHFCFGLCRSIFFLSAPRYHAHSNHCLRGISRNLTRKCRLARRFLRSKKFTPRTTPNIVRYLRNKFGDQYCDTMARPFFSKKRIGTHELFFYY